MDTFRSRPPSTTGVDPGTTQSADDPDLAIETAGSDGVVSIRLNGELDMLTAPLLSDAIEELRIAGSRRFMVDMTDLSFMDLAGLSALSAGPGQHPDAPEIAVTGCRASVRRVFELTGREHLIRQTAASSATGPDDGDDSEAPPG